MVACAGKTRAAGLLLGLVLAVRANDISYVVNTDGNPRSYQSCPDGRAVVASCSSPDGTLCGRPGKNGFVLGINQINYAVPGCGDTDWIMSPDTNEDISFVGAPVWICSRSLAPEALRCPAGSVMTGLCGGPLGSCLIGVAANHPGGTVSCIFASTAIRCSVVGPGFEVGTTQETASGSGNFEFHDCEGAASQSNYVGGENLNKVMCGGCFT